MKHFLIIGDELEVIYWCSETLCNSSGLYIRHVDPVSCTVLSFLDIDLHCVKERIVCLHFCFWWNHALEQGVEFDIARFKLANLCSFVAERVVLQIRMHPHGKVKGYLASCLKGPLPSRLRSDELR